MTDRLTGPHRNVVSWRSNHPVDDDDGCSENPVTITHWLSCLTRHWFSSLWQWRSRWWTDWKLSGLSVVCSCGSVDSCCCVKSTRPLHCRLLPTNKEILPGFYLSLLLPKTFCAIRSQWQRRWFSPRPTFCCPSSFVEAGSDWCVFEFWLNRTTNKRLFYTAGEYFGQLIFDVWNNKLFLQPWAKEECFDQIFEGTSLPARILYWLHFVTHFWDGNSASTMNVLDKWLQVC